MGDLDNLNNDDNINNNEIGENFSNNQPDDVNEEIDTDINENNEKSNIPNKFSAGFYKERFKKNPKKARNKLSGWTKLVLIAVGGSILGSMITAFTIHFIPRQPSAKQYLDRILDRQVEASGENSNKDYQNIKLGNYDSPTVAIAQKVGPSIVGVSVTTTVNDFYLGKAEANPQGSGIIIRKDGYVVTNNHVISSALTTGTTKLKQGSKIQIVLLDQKSKMYDAQVIGRDDRTDLAVLKIDGADNLPVAELGDSDSVKVGELAVAIGNPGGLEYMGSVTSGIISGLNRKISESDGKELKVIQTDAAINPGNSGGGLVNSRGQIIGINVAKVDMRGYEGLGFAIPINTAKQITNSLIESGYVKGRSLIGITPNVKYTEAVAKEHNLPEGVYVADVSMFSGAHKAGIKAGDIITKVAGQQVKSIDDMNNIKAKYKPGDSIDIEVCRDGNTKLMKVELIEDKS